MGGLNPFKKPKVPKPPVLQPVKQVTTPSETAVTEDRLRRQRASGTQGNLISSLGQAVSDKETSTVVSKLLGG